MGNSAWIHPSDTILATRRLYVNTALRFFIDVQNGRKQSFAQMTDVMYDLIQFSSTMMFLAFVRYMLQLRQGVKNTPAHVHESYSCRYNILCVHIMARYIWAPCGALGHGGGDDEDEDDDDDDDGDDDDDSA